MDLSESWCLLGHVSYPAYPIRVWRSGECLVAMEGRIYGRGHELVAAELNDLSHELFDSGKGADRLVKQWTAAQDGEYVIVLLHPARRRVFVFTDPLGRLPLYYSLDDRRLLLSRECNFIVDVQGKATFDRIALAQFLCFGYPIGTRTLFDGVQRAPAALALSAEASRGRLQAETRAFVEHDLGQKDSPARPIRNYASDLVDLFVAGVRARRTEEGVPVLVSLSGGMDSRAVAAAMKRANLVGTAVTYVGLDRKGARDAAIARRIAEALAMPWWGFSVAPARRMDEERLVALKVGLNYVGMAFILPMMDAIVARWGREPTLFTGDYGDKLLPRKAPYGRIPSLDRLTEHVLGEHQRIGASQAEALFGLPAGTIAEQLHRVIAAYPEDDLGQRSAHFWLYERGRRWIGEGEDRSRFFLWQSSPFLSLPFFERAIRVPDELKDQLRLYRLFEIELSAATASLPEATFGSSPSSAAFPAQVWLREVGLRLPKRTRFAIKRVLGMTERFNIPAEAWMAIDGDHLTPPLASPSAVREMLRSADEFTFSNWWTLVLLARRWQGVGLSDPITRIPDTDEG
ncbi:MAG: asparagine synthase-related protein [Chloroflexota bacterium]|nr:asparagine synthase-related protein [Chloroflexota bacterium]